MGLLYTHTHTISCSHQAAIAELQAVMRRVGGDRCEGSDVGCLRNSVCTHTCSQPPVCSGFARPST